MLELLLDTLERRFDLSRADLWDRLARAHIHSRPIYPCFFAQLLVPDLALASSVEAVDTIADTLQLPHIVVECLQKYILAQIPSRAIKASQLSLAPTLDDLLHGGLALGEVTEIAGPSASGKTQFCLSTTLHSLLNGSHVVYIDTQSPGFSLARLRQLYSFQKPPKPPFKDLLAHLHYYQIFDLDECFQLLTSLPTETRLVIIDSIHPLLIGLFGRSGSYGYTLIHHTKSLLSTIAHDSNLSILVVNHVVLDNYGHTTKQGSWKPALGKTWTGASHTLLMVTHTTSLSMSIRHATRFVGSKEPVTFMISPRGLSIPPT